MNKHKHDTPPGYHKQEKHNKKTPPHKVKSSSGIHKDWRAWVAIVLMLGAMATYVLTMDESIRPGMEGPGEEMPAAAGE